MSTTVIHSDKSIYSILAGCLWLAVICIGFLWAWRYESVAGTQGNTPNQWPRDPGPIALQKSGTCLLFAHPRCPCTGASLRQLSEILATRPAWQNVQIVFYRPASSSSDWSDSSIVRSAVEMSHVRIIWDDNGHLAQQFGVETSGHVLLYDAGGKLRFSGGITAFRGHHGDNSGAESLVEFGRGQNITTQQTPVYGCSLVTPKFSEIPCSAGVDHDQPR